MGFFSHLVAFIVGGIVFLLASAGGIVVFLSIATKKNEKYVKRKLSEDTDPNTKVAQEARDKLTQTHELLKTFPDLRDRPYERLHEQERKNVLKKRASLRHSIARKGSSRAGALGELSSPGDMPATASLAATMGPGTLSAAPKRASVEFGGSNPLASSLPVSPLSLSRSGSQDLRSPSALNMHIAMLPLDAKPAIAGVMEISLSKVWMRKFCCVYQGHLYWGFSASKDLCEGAIGLEGVELRIKKRKKRFNLEISADKKENIFSARGPKQEPIVYPRMKQRPYKLVVRFDTESDARSWLRALKIETSKASNESTCTLERCDRSNFDADTALDCSDDDSETVTESTTLDDDDFFEEMAALSGGAPVDKKAVQEAVREAKVKRAHDGQGNVEVNREGMLLVSTDTNWGKVFCVLDGNAARLTLYPAEKTSQVDEEALCWINLRDCTCTALEKVQKPGSKSRMLYPFIIRQPEARRIFTFHSRTEYKNLPCARSHAMESEILFRAESQTDCQRWLLSILEAIESAPVESAEVSVPRMPAPQPDDPFFANPLLERIFYDMQDSDVFRDAITTTITKKIATLTLPDFLGPVHLDRVVFGESFVKVHSVRTSVCEPNEVISEIDLEYRGGAGADISTEIYINWPRSKAGTIALSITVRLIELAGKMNLYCPPNRQERWSVFFPEDPHVNFQVIIKAGGKEVSQIAKLRKFILSTMRKLIIQKLVFPARITFNVPFPGRKLDVKPVSGSSIPSTREKGPHVQRPLGYEGTNVLAMKFIVGQFIDQVLNKGCIDSLDRFFLEDCEVTGTNPFYHQPLRGYSEIEQMVTEFDIGFPDLHFYIVNMNWEGSNLYVRFRARGTHQGVFWETLPSNKPVILSGMMVANISDTKIRALFFYWDPQSVFLFS